MPRDPREDVNRLKALLRENSKALRVEQQRKRRAQQRTFGLSKFALQTAQAVFHLEKSAELAILFAQRRTSLNTSDVGYPSAAALLPWLRSDQNAQAALPDRAFALAKKFCAEATVLQRAQKLNFEHGVAPSALWAYDTFHALTGHEEQQPTRLKIAWQWARRWRSRWGVVRRALRTDDELSRESLQQKDWQS